MTGAMTDLLVATRLGLRATCGEPVQPGAGCLRLCGHSSAQRQ